MSNDDYELTVDDEFEDETEEDSAWAAKLSPAVIRAAEFLPIHTAGDLVRTYYGVQEYRLKLDNQIRAYLQKEHPDILDKLRKKLGLKDTKKDNKKLTSKALAKHLSDHKDPGLLIAYYVRNPMAAAEERARKSLDYWTRHDDLSLWARDVIGIGPVLAAGLRSQINMARSPSVSSLWSFAGYNPDMVWERGQRRPYNAFLKVICWRIGDSFVKVSGKPNSLYGRIYREEKERRVTLNESGGNAEKAQAVLEGGVRVPRSGTDARAALEQGKLPKLQIDLQARRKPIKLFLSHYWVAGRTLKGLSTESPYIIASPDHPKHTHYIEPEVEYPKLPL